MNIKDYNLSNALKQLAKEIMTVVRKGNEYIHQANKGNPTIGQLARRLNEQCEIQLDKDDVELLRKFSIFEEGDPYD